MIGMNARKLKGEQIAKTCQIEKNGMDKWLVPSQSGSGSYVVSRYGEGFKCNCPDFQLRGDMEHPCKHVYAVEIKVLKWFDSQGNATEITIKKTYSQNWQVYDKSQKEEKIRFMELLKDLLENVDEPIYSFGRPKNPIRDMLFASGLKVYTQFSLRRFQSDLGIAKEKGFIEHTASFTSIGQFMQKEEMTPILHKLIQLSSLPLQSVESQFAVDSTGFRTTHYTEYCKEKHGIKREHEWIKVHAICGVKTNIITAVSIGEEHGNDSPEFMPLVKSTHENGFNMKEVSGDKAYLSHENLDGVAELGGIAYIPFKSNSQQHAHGSKVWNKMFYYFQMCRDEFMEHYHMRSNIETAFFMIKAKFNDTIRSKDKIAQINEALLKVLCHNIVVVANETNEMAV